MSSTTANILDVGGKVVFDDSIESIEFHPYTPYNDSYKNNDAIHICINRQDLIVLPSQSQLLIEGNTKECLLVNNAPAFLFQDIRYELNGVEIDRTRDCGITSTMKGLVSYSKDMDFALENAGWCVGAKKEHSEFSFTIPLSHLLGFAEDYKKVIMNAKHELIINRATTDLNAIECKDVAKKPEVEITRVIWRMPVLKVSDKEKLRLMSYMEADFETNSYPLLFDAFSNFQMAYYNREYSSPQLNRAHYKTQSPLIVIDTSRQPDSYSSGGGAVDIKVEMEFKKNVPANTAAYCLVINDTLFEYNMLTNTTRKLIQ
ncbi:uncharacterized protein LOC133515619 [Cydia pomonella]|uniref:uncharacterized protein LOC133515619 n=1 Tax=Cydia pomonella TaxID=82600 RepID=UPI002ADD4D21|nr:uncharacterized protein LOC133515619 [Cydia pomonella]